jgi:transposase
MSCYSLDLRQRVINHLEKGNSIRKTAEAFEISFRTVFNWKKRNESNILKPDNNLIRAPKKINQQELERYIEKNSEKTVSEIANHLNVWYNAVYYRIKKANLVYKKKNFSTQKEMRNKEKNTLKK